MKPMVIANWKMNPTKKREALKTARGIVSGLRSIKKTNVVICPPFPYLSLFTEKIKSKKVQFGAQNSFYIDHGSFTGEVSPPMLADLGVQHVIVGHSERRALGETNAIVAKKIKAILGAGLHAVVCIGEHERGSDGNYLSFIKQQIHESLAGVYPKKERQITIAYEPLWAIGKTARDAIKPHDIHETALFIKKVLTQQYDSTVAKRIAIIYGGSVEPSNAASLIDHGGHSDVQGFLVGHASLDAHDFVEIVKTVEMYG